MHLRVQIDLFVTRGQEHAPARFTSAATHHHALLGIELAHSAEQEDRSQGMWFNRGSAQPKREQRGATTAADAPGQPTGKAERL